MILGIKKKEALISGEIKANLLIVSESKLIY
ncbi:hypothetical protein HNP72_001773 [Sphingobacterium soli]|nr:hypothetical protein [Sphingobacterium soli]